MRRLLKEIEGEETAKTKARLLTFKEFCKYFYEPSKKLREIRLSQAERTESKSGHFELGHNTETVF